MTWQDYLEYGLKLGFKVEILFRETHCFIRYINPLEGNISDWLELKGR